MRNGPVDPHDLSALSPWADELARTFVSLSSDIALVIDASGVITTVEQNGAQPMAPGAARWVGRPWVDTVSGETRRKVELLLQEVVATGSGRRREINHLAAGGLGIPVAYTAIRLGADGPVLAVGRDLRSVAAIQQRFLSHQQELERSYWRAREAETRERRLHQVATDAMFLVDAPTLAIERVGPLPSEWSGAFNEPMSGRLLAELFDAHSRGPLDELLATARGMGRPLEIRVRLRATHQSVSVAATPLRVGDAQRLLVRVRGIAETAVSPTELVVIGDSTGRLASCTPRVVELAAASDEAGLRGRSVADAIGAAPQAFATLLADVRHDGIAAASMALRRHDGLRWPARVAATLLTEGDQECIGFVITPEHAARPDEPPSSTAAVAAGLADRLGSAPLRQLMSEAAAQVERELIASALQRSGGDERAAAGLLGVSLTGLRRRQRKGKTTREATRDGHQPAQRGERHEQ